MDYERERRRKKRYREAMRNRIIAAVLLAGIIVGAIFIIKGCKKDDAPVDEDQNQPAVDAVKPVVYCGDLNVAHQEIDLKNPKTNRLNPGFSDEERGKMTQLLSSGFVDTFRALYPERTGAYSWWSYRFHARENNAGWRIDYFIVSQRLMPRVKSADIWPEITGSDHCPVVLELAE